jgi:hypothetical protein
MLDSSFVKASREKGKCVRAAPLKEHPLIVNSPMQYLLHASVRHE